MNISLVVFFFFFNDTATTEIYTLSLHDALPIWPTSSLELLPASWLAWMAAPSATTSSGSEEHTSELQSLRHLVCRLLLEKKKRHVITPEAQACRKLSDDRIVTASIQLAAIY